METPTRLVSIAVRTAVLGIVFLLPLSVLGRGFAPPDDALRHAAKAVSGKPWDQILVLRPDLTMDPHPGWHAVLGAVHRLAGGGPRPLVLFSVVTLFVLVNLAPALLLRRPESWLLALLVLAVADPTMLWRFMLGRPFLANVAAVVVVCLCWPPLREPRLRWGILALLTVVFAGATWIHGNYYLFALPLACFFLAGERRVGARLTACFAAGTLLGAALTGTPFVFLWQALHHAYVTLDVAAPLASLSVEIQPAIGSPLMVLAVLGVVGWRALRGAGRREPARDPVLWLVATGWALGFVVLRFWSDWAVPAALAWMALAFQEALEAGMEAESGRRLRLAAAAMLVAFLAITSDVQGRWSGPITGDRPFLTTFVSARNPEHAPWLPEPGGILYTADIRLFFRTFFENPEAPWRYILGFEPALMRPEDLAVYRAVLKAPGDPAPFLPWVQRMRPEDRLFVVHLADMPPDIPALEWHPLLQGLWSGRLPRSATPAAAGPLTPP
jgi:hypothetical protein